MSAPLSAGALLRALGVEWFVELTTTDLVGVWDLVITKRRGAFSARSFRGDLEDITRRAIAGEPADSVSR